MRRSIALLVLALLAPAGWLRAGDTTPPDGPYAGDLVVRTWLSSQGELDFMRSISPDCWSDAAGIGQVDWRIRQPNLDRLKASGIRHEILIEDVQRLIDAETARLAKARGGPMGPGTWFMDFKDIDQVNAYLDGLEAARPDLATVVTLGMSLEGRAIRGIRITGPGTGKPAILFNGGQHAREWIGVMVPMYIADQLIALYDTDPTIQSLVDEIEFFIVPIVNPDGYVYSWGPNRLWRKNRRDNGDGTFGVDLNRNWSVGWGGPGSSPDPSSETYHGPAAFSEPETQVMRDFYLAHPELVANIDFHSFGQKVLSPWGYTYDPTPDAALFDDMGFMMASTIYLVHSYFYVHGPAASTLYLASGVSIDWAYGDRGVLSFTTELRDTGAFGFLLPPDQIIPTCEENFPAAMAMADFVRQGVVFALPKPLPTILEAGAPTPVSIDITPITSGPLDPATAKLLSRTDPAGAFTASPMTNSGGSLYDGTLPGTACGLVLQFYFEIQSTAGQVYRLPDDAPASFYEASAVEIDFGDDFESDLGWTVQDVNLLGGSWERGLPAGDGSRGDPTTDFDGSGACYLTGNGPGDTDVDGGPTRLISPVLDLTALVDPHVGYARWFFNDDSDQDRLDVEISGDGGASWTTVESVGNTNGWTVQTVRIADFLTPTSTMVVRFSATDNPNDSITESAIDAFRVWGLACTPNPADLNGDGVVDVLDLLDLLAVWGSCDPPCPPSCPADLNEDCAVDVLDLLQMLAGWG